MPCAVLLVPVLEVLNVLSFFWQLLLTELLVSEMAPKSPSRVVAASAGCKPRLLGYYTYLSRM